MGRRKIEIQPITHERNRSVTFLKRKNGLFKKAYELGVLCSVDVAVIIFEERPGHHVKLYQYGSSDIHDIVQRHLRHDGEKDTRGPTDFSGNTSSKLDDTGDGDEDDADEEEELPRAKRGRDGKPKPGSDLLNSIDYGHNHRSLSIPQPPSLSIHGGGSSIPISDDRLGARDSKRRLGLHPHSRSPPDDAAGNGYSYHPGQAQAPFAGQNQYHPPSRHGNNSHYQPFFPVSSHTSPPPSFIPLQSDFSRGPNPSSRGGGGGSYSAIPSRTHDPGMYGNMISTRSQPTGPGGPAGGDLFAVFMDPNEQSRQQQPTQNQQAAGFGVSLDWPVHGPGAGPSGGSTASGNPSAPSSGGEGPQSNNWLDFLSGNSNSNASGREAMSWERGGGTSGTSRNDVVDMFGGGDRGRGAMGASPMVVGISGGKRGRPVEDEVGLLPSPPGGHVRSDDGIGKKEGPS